MRIFLPPAFDWLARTLMLALVLLVLGCATVPPPYVCISAVTDTGQQVIYCRPYSGDPAR